MDSVQTSKKRLLQLNISKELSVKLKKIALAYDLNQSSLARFLLIKGLNNLEQEDILNRGFTEEEEMEIIKRSRDAAKGKNVSPVFSSANESIAYLNHE